MVVVVVVVVAWASMAWQAFIQMATIAAAEACINYFTEFSALVRYVSGLPGR